MFLSQLNEDMDRIGNINYNSHRNWNW